MVPHICVNGRMIPSVPGGVEQATTGLLRALSAHADGLRISVLVYDDHLEAFAPHASGAVSLVASGKAPVRLQAPDWTAAIKPLARTILRRLGLRSNGLDAEPPAIAALRPDVVHFPWQIAWRSSIPCIYQPWDLQHRHLPQFFSTDELAYRNRLYGAGCAQAAAVVVASEWGRRDVISYYGIDPARVRVIPMAAPTDGYPSLSAAEVAQELARFGLAGPYAYFPAQSWPHKNHLAVVRALARLRADGGPAISLVCSGRRTDHFAVVEAEAARLGIAAQLRHVGFVDTRAMVALYAGARLLVFPSLFEGWGLPITEAMSLGVPIAAARSTCIPEQLGEAGVLFDPNDDAQIAVALRSLWEDEALRERCIARGRERVANYTWAATARAFLELYRELARAGSAEAGQAR